MKILKHNKYLFLLLFTLPYILFGCSEEACPEQYEMGTFYLANSTKELFPYKDSIINIVFQDGLGNEVHGIVEENLITGIGTNKTQRDCIYNPDEEVEIIAYPESMRRVISIPELDMGFDIRFRVSPNFSYYEDDLIQDFANIVFISASTTPAPTPQMIIILDQRNDPDLPSFSDMPTPILTLLQKDFANVYSNFIGRDSLDFYYNNEIGILGFKQRPNGELYVFDRFE